jgi:peptidoglycan/xylan/chitin deacetylase (PgdA/CDA1 family)
VWLVLPAGTICVMEAGINSGRESEQPMPATVIGRVYRKLLAVPRLPSSFRYIQGDYATVLMLHRFRDRERGATGTEAVQLQRSLEYLRRNRYELVSLVDLFRRLAGQGPRLRGAVAFTIDDGYRDQAEIAAPIFREFDCPVTTFVTTGFLDGTLWFWWDKIEYVVSNTRRKSLTVEVGDTRFRYDPADASQPSSMIQEFVEYCKALALEQKHAAIACLAQEAEVDLPDTPPSRYAPMTWDDVRACEGRGMSFGPHTVSHPILSRTQADRARLEITESWRRLRAEARDPVPVFCYPNGDSADFGAREIALARELGFLGALTAEDGFADPVSFRKSEEGPFRVKRMPFPEELPTLAQYVGGIERFKRIVQGRAV